MKQFIQLVSALAVSIQQGLLINIKNAIKLLYLVFFLIIIFIILNLLIQLDLLTVPKLYNLYS